MSQRAGFAVSLGSPDILLSTSEEERNAESVQKTHPSSAFLDDTVGTTSLSEDARFFVKSRRDPISAEA